MDLIFEVGSFSTSCLRPRASAPALSDLLGWDVAWGDHLAGAKLREQLRVQTVIFHLDNT